MAPPRPRGQRMVKTTRACNVGFKRGSRGTLLASAPFGKSKNALQRLKSNPQRPLHRTRFACGSYPTQLRIDLIPCGVEARHRIEARILRVVKDIIQLSLKLPIAMFVFERDIFRARQLPVVPPRQGELVAECAFRCLCDLRLSSENSIIFFGSGGIIFGIDNKINMRMKFGIKCHS
jgi:hypothetical protein